MRTLTKFLGGALIVAGFVTYGHWWMSNVKASVQGVGGSVATGFQVAAAAVTPVRLAPEMYRKETPKTAIILWVQGGDVYEFAWVTWDKVANMVDSRLGDPLVVPSTAPGFPIILNVMNGNSLRLSSDNLVGLARKNAVPTSAIVPVDVASLLPIPEEDDEAAGDLADAEDEPELAKALAAAIELHDRLMRLGQQRLANVK